MQDKDNTHRGRPPVLPGAHEVVEDVPELVGVGGARVVPHGRQQPEPVLAPRPQVLRRDALRLAVRQVRHRPEVGRHVLGGRRQEMLLGSFRNGHKSTSKIPLPESGIIAMLKMCMRAAKGLIQQQLVRVAPSYCFQVPLRCQYGRH